MSPINFSLRPSIRLAASPGRRGHVDDAEVVKIPTVLLRALVRAHARRARVGAIAWATLLLHPQRLVDALAHRDPLALAAVLAVLFVPRPLLFLLGDVQDWGQDVSGPRCGGVR